MVMCVNPSFPARTVSEFVARAKASPDGLNCASSGVGSPPHVAAELFMAMTDIRMLHVPYRGDIEAITDLVAGRVDAYFATLAGSIQFIHAGRLPYQSVRRPLPEVPAMAEFLPGYDATIWNGLNAPKGTPQTIIMELNRQVNSGLANPELIARFLELGARVRPGSPEDYANLVSAETEKWGAIVKSTGSKLE
jgi:tripartite-type tricarboxylate transporter receptor subunit TctC